MCSEGEGPWASGSSRLGGRLSLLSPVRPGGKQGAAPGSGHGMPACGCCQHMPAPTLRSREVREGRCCCAKLAPLAPLLPLAAAMAASMAAAASRASAVPGTAADCQRRGATTELGLLWKPTTRTGLPLRLVWLGCGSGLSGCTGDPLVACCANDEAKGDTKSAAAAILALLPLLLTDAAASAAATTAKGLPSGSGLRGRQAVSAASPPQPASSAGGAAGCSTSVSVVGAAGRGGGLVSLSLPKSRSGQPWRPGRPRVGRGCRTLRQGGGGLGRAVQGAGYRGGPRAAGGAPPPAAPPLAVMVRHGAPAGRPGRRPAAPPRAAPASERWFRTGAWTGCAGVGAEVGGERGNARSGRAPPALCGRQGQQAGPGEWPFPWGTPACPPSAIQMPRRGSARRPGPQARARGARPRVCLLKRAALSLPALAALQHHGRHG